MESLQAQIFIESWHTSSMCQSMWYASCCALTYSRLALNDSNINKTFECCANKLNSSDWMNFNKSEGAIPLQTVRCVVEIDDAAENPFVWGQSGSCVRLWRQRNEQTDGIIWPTEIMCGNFSGVEESRWSRKANTICKIVGARLTLHTNLTSYARCRQCFVHLISISHVRGI